MRGVGCLEFAQASCDEATDQAKTVKELYPYLTEFIDIHADLEKLGKMITNYITYVENNWKT